MLVVAVVLRWCGGLGVSNEEWRDIGRKEETEQMGEAKTTGTIHFILRLHIRGAVPSWDPRKSLCSAMTRKQAHKTAGSTPTGSRFGLEYGVRVDVERSGGTARSRRRGFTCTWFAFCLCDWARRWVVKL